MIVFYFYFFFFKNRVFSKHTQRARWTRPTPQPDLVSSGSGERSHTFARLQAKEKKKTGDGERELCSGFDPSALSRYPAHRCVPAAVWSSPVTETKAILGNQSRHGAPLGSATCVGTNRCLLGCFGADVILLQMMSSLLVGILTQNILEPRMDRFSCCFPAMSDHRSDSQLLGPDGLVQQIPCRVVRLPRSYCAASCAPSRGGFLAPFNSKALPEYPTTSSSLSARDQEFPFTLCKLDAVLEN